MNLGLRGIIELGEPECLSCTKEREFIIINLPGLAFMQEDLIEEDYLI